LQRDKLVVDHRADVYSLGSVFYELFTGRAVFEADDEKELVRKVLVEEPDAPRKANRALPADLDTILQNCLLRDARLRYGSAGEVAEELERFLRGERVRRHPPSFRYHVRLAVKKNPAAAATGVGLVLTLVAALWATLHLLGEKADALAAAT